MDRPAWVGVVGGIVITILIGGACCCGGIGYMAMSQPALDLSDERAEREGMTAGQTGTSESCIVATHDRTLLCGFVDPDCTLAAQAFLRSCLRAVPAPDPSICTGVPTPSTLGDWDFADQVCARRGWVSENGECDPIADGLSVYCHGQ